MGHVFETDRLVVRQWTEEPADVARVYDMLSRWEVARWLGARPRALETRPRRWRRSGAGGRAAPRTAAHGVWAAEDRQDQTVGTVLVVPLPGPDDRPTADIEVGWHLHPDSWGNGYATEAARAAIEREFAAGAAGALRRRPRGQRALGGASRAGWA